MAPGFSGTSITSMREGIHLPSPRTEQKDFYIPEYHLIPDTQAGKEYQSQ